MGGQNRRRRGECLRSLARTPLTVHAVAQGTVYAGHVYAISLSFPPTYPYAAPTVRFETTCYRQSRRRSSFRHASSPTFLVQTQMSTFTATSVSVSSLVALLFACTDGERIASTDILKEKWSPMLSVSTLLISIQSLLGGAYIAPHHDLATDDESQSPTIDLLSTSKLPISGMMSKPSVSRLILS